MDFIEWTPKTHERFAKETRQMVKLLLLIQKRVVLPKDIFLYHLIPAVVGQVKVPLLYMSNLSFDWSESEAEAFFTQHLGRITELRIARRSNGRSKGFGFLRLYFLDDYFSSQCEEFIVNDRMVIVVRSVLN